MWGHSIYEGNENFPSLTRPKIHINQKDYYKFQAQWKTFKSSGDNHNQISSQLPTLPLQCLRPCICSAGPELKLSVGFAVKVEKFVTTNQEKLQIANCTQKYMYAMKKDNLPILRLLLKFNNIAIFGIIPEIMKIPKCTSFSATKFKKKFPENFWKNFWIFSVFSIFLPYSLVIIPKIPKNTEEIQTINQWSYLCAGWRRLNESTNHKND